MSHILGSKPDTACIPWANTTRRVPVRVLREKYAAAYGPLPEGRRWFLCHACDNSVCANVAHIFVGTQRCNATDAFLKGRVGHFAPLTRPERSVGHATWAQTQVLRILEKRAPISIRNIGKLMTCGSQNSTAIRQHLVALQRRRMLVRDGSAYVLTDLAHDWLRRMAQYDKETADEEA